MRLGREALVFPKKRKHAHADDRRLGGCNTISWYSRMKQRIRTYTSRRWPDSGAKHSLTLAVLVLVQTSLLHVLQYSFTRSVKGTDVYRDTRGH
jgi:hypothetical protein